MEGGILMLEEGNQDFDIRQEANRLLLENYTPASVVVDTNLEILHVRGHASPYLELAPGKDSLNLLKMARKGLSWPLRSAISTARKENHAVTKEGLQVDEAGMTRQVRVTVEPFNGPSADYYFLLLFEETSPLPVPGPIASPSGEPAGHATRHEAAAWYIAALEQELAAIWAGMVRVIEERDTVNEELVIANEETLTINEELQNLNEALQAAKEELEANNDELTTTNQQLNARNEQLKEAQEYVEAIVETMSTPLVVLSAGLRITRANTAFYRFFRVASSETEGRSLFELGSGQWNHPRLRALLEEVLAAGRSFKDFEVEYVFPTIGHKIILLNARRIVREPIRDGLILLVMEDITERKELERQKDAFLGMVSHELKTPLSGAKLHTHLLQEGLAEAGNEQAIKDLAIIDAQLDELSRLINDLLDATALGTGNLQMRSAPFVVDDLVRSSIEEMGVIYPAAHLLLVQEAHAEVYADRARIGQVLINLLSNAIKYSPQTGAVLVRVSAETDAVSVSVQDRGVGIPQELQAKLFEPFYRASDQMQKQVPGLGLGLYIASQIVKQQGGRIEVKSEPGKGSTFSFTLPRRKSSN
jgi:two-component system CheB/CheR fusion protein